MEAGWLRFERKALGLSQFKLSILSNVSRNKISQHECGYIELNPQEILAVQATIKSLRDEMLKVGGGK